MRDYPELKGANRVLIEAELRPLQGFRFQPTGFPNLGPATYEGPDGNQLLLVESPQSMANRLEAVCWDTASNDLVAPLRGLPYVRVKLPDGRTTNSILEAHRLNSQYIMRRKGGEEGAIDENWLSEKFPELAKAKADPTNEGKLAAAVFRYDPNSVVHGIFLEKLAGGMRLLRILSAFIEAEGVRPADSGGVKKDNVDPTGKLYGNLGAELGFGSVPFHRREFTARKITAYFNIDLATLRSYGLAREQEHLIEVLALWKIRRFLTPPIRLRTACDLTLNEVRVTEPANWTLPSIEELDGEVRDAIRSCAAFFSKVIDLEWSPPKKGKKPEKELPKEEDENEEED